MIIDIGSGNKNVNFHQGGGGKGGKIDISEDKIKFGYSEFETVPKTLDMSNVKDWSQMFYKCSSLKSFTEDLSDADDLSGMFQGCSSLTDVNLNGSLNKSLFLGSSPLTEESMINVLNAADRTTDPSTKKTLAFKYRYVHDDENHTVYNTFDDCTTNKGWTISGFNLDIPPEYYQDYIAVWDGGGELSYNDSSNTLGSSPIKKSLHPEWTTIIMYQFPSEITSYKWLDTSHITSMYKMFFRCDALTSLDLSNFDTSNVKNMRDMFQNCSSLTDVNLSNFDTSNVTNMYEMFFRCDALTSLDLSNFDTSNVKNMSYMFYYCSALTDVNLSNFDTSNVTNMSYMFDGCYKLTKLILSSKFFNSTSLTTYNFSQATAWTDADSLATFVDALPQLDGTTKTVMLSTNTKNALTDEQKTTIANKGWTIA